MMFRRSHLLVALASMSLSGVDAFVVRTPAAAHSSTNSGMRLFSAVEEPKTMAMQAGGVVELNDEYRAALDGAMVKLTAVLGEEKTSLLDMLQHFVGEYLGSAQAAVQDLKDSNVSDEELALYAPQAAAGRILQGIQYAQRFGMPHSPDHYQFDVTHQALRGNPETEHGNTVDYYAFGCDFFRPAMNLPQSVVLGQDNLKQAMDQLAKGENVVFFANHQSEADPQVVSCLLEKEGYTEQAAACVYVAGHKVTTDALAIPFSMGRNLICIHSKKHINAEPDKKADKQRQNLQAMSAMLDKLKQGGCLLWVAPSGGRDRRNVETGQVPPAEFDSKTIDMFRLMGNKSKQPTHYYPMAMVSYDLCPPPDTVEAGVGEQRNVRYVPVGIHVGKEAESVGGVETRKKFAQDCYEACFEDYNVLLEAMGMERLTIDCSVEDEACEAVPEE